MSAFRLALEMGAGAVELDVHQTAHRELVVIHDEDLRRVGGRFDQIRDMSWQELCRFDVGTWFDAKFRGEIVPQFEDVLALLGNKTEIHAELKRGSSIYPGIEERLVALLRKRRALKSCVISSFEHPALFKVRELESKARIGYLLGDTPLESAWEEMKALQAESLNLSLRQVTAARVAAAHRRKLKVLVYTVNDAADARRLEKMGVDGIFSNFPRLLEKAPSRRAA
jgi:glycerophosphoryl diester phosphodiesterase